MAFRTANLSNLCLLFLTMMTSLYGFTSLRVPMWRLRYQSIPFSYRASSVIVRSSSSSSSASEAGVITNDKRPKVIVFDLDGCLWRPEMYELLWEGRGSPFTPVPSENGTHDGDGLTRMKSATGTQVELIGDVTEILDDLYLNPDWSDTILALSSRTDEPNWARELLDKFTLPQSQTTLAKVFSGPNILSYERKTAHFERISQATGVSFEDMMFLDNEYGNCAQVSKMGVTVGFCPNGVTHDIFQRALQSYPAIWGEVVE